MKYYIQLMRPKQWTKNLIIFAGIIFANELTNLTYVLICVEAFIIFCILSGVVYIINDILDIEKDRIHPAKKLRPIASGKAMKQRMGAKRPGLPAPAKTIATTMKAGTYPLGRYEVPK